VSVELIEFRVGKFSNPKTNRKSVLDCVADDYGPHRTVAR